jgi:hypothetical protein
VKGEIPNGDRKSGQSALALRLQTDACREEQRSKKFSVVNTGFGVNAPSEYADAGRA